MSAFETTINFMKLWYSYTQPEERKLVKFLRDGLDEIAQKDSDVLAKISVGPDTSNPIVRWMEERGYPHAVTAQLATATMTFSGNLFGAAVSTASLVQVIRVNTVLQRQSDGFMVIVSSVAGILDGTPFEATVAAHGNRSLPSDDSGPVTWEIIGELWSDYKDADSSRALTRDFREVGTQIHAETFEIPKTRRNTRYELVANEVEHQIQALLSKLRRQLAYSVLRMEPVYSSGYKYGNAVEVSSMLGISNWPKVTQAEEANTNVYVNASSAELTKTMLDDLVRNMFLDEHADFNRGSWYIVVHPLLHKYISDFDISYRRTTKDEKSVGFTVENFDSKIGKTFPILPDRYMLPHELLVCNFDSMEYGYYSNDKMDRKEISTQGRYQRWLISFQTYGVVCRKPRQNIGKIYGLAYS